MNERGPGRGEPGVLLATVTELRGRKGKGWLGCQTKNSQRFPIGFRSMLAPHDLER